MSLSEKLTTIAENEVKVYEAGKQTQYDEFWDNFQQNGTRGIYDNAFSSVYWNDTTFKPKDDIRPTSAEYMFRYNYNKWDLVEKLKELDIKLDFSECTGSFTGIFWSSSFSRVGVIDMSKAKGATLYYTFRAAPYLETIDEWVVPETITNFVNVFDNLSKLKNLNVTGVINGNGLNFQWSTELTHGSLMSIINALADKTNDNSKTWVLTLGTTNLANLSDTEKAKAIKKGWSLA